MAGKSKIEWTEATWNPVTGCTKISAGCTNCYAERLAMRLKAMGQLKYRNGFKVTLQEKALDYPLLLKTPKIIFVNSMSDLFHEDVPFEYIKKIFDIMKQASWHRFQVLTKRSERLAELSSLLEWSPNIWLGVTVENNDCIFRIDHLRETNAHIKFLSLEPLIGPLPDINLTNIDWVIVGGESGPGSRPMKEEWVHSIRDSCQRGHIPFFFKQWGGVNKKKAGRILDGRTWDEIPNYARLDKHVPIPFSLEFN
ncbi:MULTISPECIES: DUF5131 family protein [Pelosinus]|jgi:protein gp37|uniref:Gp37Gp68 family protein n=1 Tax=Pelosinus fermentans B4 TaxID=1149862 RepID=I8RE00_9FIRM|nr:MULTISPECIES: phage Gp37/Gp68 family protein [Pelosinus]EIW17528.1 Gp37Gp68 family protein [Pelosinus fermentans B4]EIW23588.1 Gp37Gp68 family protein [Pelosinus fermentans A11]OAM92083.1 Gp37Gp68 family protein [Pelosinus fermentans DSM 17108]SDQ32887.1 protein gp37 [Pelosinus fermentans]